MKFEDYKVLAELNPRIKKDDAATVARRYGSDEETIKDYRKRLKEEKKVSSFVDDLKNTPSLEELEQIAYRHEVNKKVPVCPDGFLISSYKDGNTWFKRDESVTATNELDTDFILKTLSSTVKPVKSKSTKVNDKVTKIFYLSDLHIGQMIESDALLGGTYNEQVYKERLYSILPLINSEDDVVLCVMADIVDGWSGETYRKGHKLPQNLSNKEQYRVFIESFQTLITSVIDIVGQNNVCVYCCSEGNHEGELCFIYCDTLRMWVEAKYPDFGDFYVMDKFVEGVVLNQGLPNEHYLFLSHGKDKQELKTGLSLHLNDKVENYLVKVLKTYMPLDKMDYRNVSFVKGDSHRSASQIGDHFRYRSVLPLAPPSKWIQTNYASAITGISYDIFSKDGIFESQILFNHNK